MPVCLLCNGRLESVFELASCVPTKHFEFVHIFVIIEYRVLGSE